MYSTTFFSQVKCEKSNRRMPEPLETIAPDMAIHHHPAFGIGFWILVHQVFLPMRVYPHQFKPKTPMLVPAFRQVGFHQHLRILAVPPCSKKLLSISLPVNKPAMCNTKSKYNMATTNHRQVLLAKIVLDMVGGDTTMPGAWEARKRENFR
jgi:hypothetical protein